MSRPLLIASDHAGFELKEKLKRALEGMDVPYRDLGVASADPVDYPDQAHALAEGVSRGEADRGLLVCGSGQGMAMTANRYRGVRAALAADEETARLSREHNDANVLAMGARVVAPGLADEILELWLATPFEGGRHQRRVDQLADIERQEHEGAPHAVAPEA